jgi:hypothetical protein
MRKVERRARINDCSIAASLESKRLNGDKQSRRCGCFRDTNNNGGRLFFTILACFGWFRSRPTMQRKVATDGVQSGCLLVVSFSDNTDSNDDNDDDDYDNMTKKNHVVGVTTKKNIEEEQQQGAVVTQTVSNTNTTTNSNHATDTLGRVMWWRKVVDCWLCL